MNGVLAVLPFLLEHWCITCKMYVAYRADEKHSSVAGPESKHRRFSGTPIFCVFIPSFHFFIHFLHSIIAFRYFFLFRALSFPSVTVAVPLVVKTINN